MNNGIGAILAWIGLGILIGVFIVVAVNSAIKHNEERREYFSRLDQVTYSCTLDQGKAVKNIVFQHDPKEGKLFGRFKYRTRRPIMVGYVVTRRNVTRTRRISLENIFAEPPATISGKYDRSKKRFVCKR